MNGSVGQNLTSLIFTTLSLRKGNLFFVKSVVNKVLSVLLTYLPSRKIRSEGNYLLEFQLCLNFYQYGWDFIKRKKRRQIRRSHRHKHVVSTLKNTFWLNQVSHEENLRERPKDKKYLRPLSSSFDQRLERESWGEHA